MAIPVSTTHYKHSNDHNYNNHNHDCCHCPAIIPIGGPSGTTREYIVRHGDSTKVQDQRKLCTMYEIALTYVNCNIYVYLRSHIFTITSLKQT